MRAETFIAQRIYFSQSTAHRTSKPAVRVALLGMIIGVMVMVVTLCVVIGFKQTITNKIAGFGAHIQVVNFDTNNTYEMEPITVNDTLLTHLASLPGVKGAYRFFTKPGIIKTEDAFEGMVLKGTDYWDYFASNLVEGTLPSAANEVIISQSLSQRMRIPCGDGMLCYFVGEEVKARKTKVVGVYATGFEDFDRLFVLSQPELIRRLNGWEGNQCSGVEVLVNHLNQLDEVADAVYFATANRLDEEGNAFYTQTIEQLNSQIFAWLDLLDMNVVVIIILMLCVSGFNIISGLIILILDSIQLIGTLKALGANNRFVRRIFITQASMLIGKGMLVGNVLGLGLCALQYFTHMIPLNPVSYYVSFVPVAFPWLTLVLLNVGVLLVSVLILLAPSAIVTRISPARVMHFE